MSMAAFLIELSKVNDFELYLKAPLGVKKLLNTNTDILNYIKTLELIKRPASYVEHKNFVNFTKYGFQKPIYINLVRHPIQKVMSAYYYVRKLETFGAYFFANVNRKLEKPVFFKTTVSDCVRQGMSPMCDFDTNNLYNHDWRRLVTPFCGHNKICRKFNSKLATQIAKRHIEEEYAVVGSWEDTNITLTVLEHYIPRFFRGATRIFYSNPDKSRINTTPHQNELDANIEQQLKGQFEFEIDVYNFAKQRLYRQYLAIQKNSVQQLFGYI